MFYTYLWLREDGTPYYVGKGTGKRGFITKKHRVKCPTKDRIVIYPAETEEEAFEIEKLLIWYYGRKDKGTGCLRNLTDGGEGASNVSEETRSKLSAFFKGKSFITEEGRKRISAFNKGKTRTLGRVAPEDERKRRSISFKNNKKLISALIERNKKNKPALGHVVSKESKEKMSIANKGKIPWMKGKKHSEESKKKNSESCKGRIPWNKGIKPKEITCGHISSVHGGHGLCKPCYLRQYYLNKKFVTLKVPSLTEEEN